MGQLTLIEIGMITNKDLAPLKANFGWVSLSIIDSILRNGKNILIQYFLINLDKIAGLKYLNILTEASDCDLRVEFTTSDGEDKYAEYKWV